METWKKIIDKLKSPDFRDINKINRASLIDDSFNLARAGLLDYDITLSAAEYLQQEEDYIPWRSGLDGLSFLIKKAEDHPQLYKPLRV